MTNPYAHLPAYIIADKVRVGEVSPTRLIEATLEHAQGSGERLNCFVELFPDTAMKEAELIERQIRDGRKLGPLAGVPVSVKDLIAVRGAPLRLGSRLTPAAPAAEDAVAVQRLRDAGAIIIGKTTTSEFGCKAVGDSPLTGMTRNPWHIGHTPGGSSAGAAASVAAGITPVALGTDGGGSLRIPAAFTGLVGFKAQFARVPAWPRSATPTLTHLGPIARDSRDAALMLHVLAGEDWRDPGSQGLPPLSAWPPESAGVQGLRLAWCPDFGYVEPDADVLACCEGMIEHFREGGATVYECLPPFADPEATWQAEFYGAISYRVRSLGHDEALIDPIVRDCLDAASHLSMLDYQHHATRRLELGDSVRAFFRECDVLISPTLPVTAPLLGTDIPARMTKKDPVTWCGYTYPFNLTGNPAVSVPAGFSASGLPVGMQLVGRYGDESTLLRLTHWLQETTKWARHVPPAD